MRTTIRIDDALYREVKVRAARSGRTVGAVLEDAVRVGLAAGPGHGARPLRIRAVSLAARPGVDLASNAALADLLDDETDRELR